MPSHIVYVLGAGFSAPLDLPLVGTFFSRSRDLFDGDREKYARFREVLDLVKGLSVAKNHYLMDLTNIEEIFSLLEIESYALGTDRRELFANYLIDVINASMRPATPADTFAHSTEWKRQVYSEDAAWRPYAHFVANLLGLRVSRTSEHRLVRTPVPNRTETYSVISLNYDMVIETAAHLINVATGGDPSQPLVTSITTTPANGEGLVLAKIHGSVHDRSVVPPSWNKGSRADVSPAWAAALEELRRANYVRILGYSLPEADAYVRYLLKVSGAHDPHLKGIDIVCLDPDEDVRDRYKKFVAVRMRFAPMDIYTYLLNMFDETRSGSPSSVSDLDLTIESTHEHFFQQFGRRNESAHRSSAARSR